MHASPRARDEAALLDDPRLLAEALSWLSRASWLTERWRDALREASSAVEALAGLDETPQLARALARLSQLEMLGGLPRAEERARYAIAVAHTVGDVHAELNARANLLVTRANRGAPFDAIEAREIVTRARESGDANEAQRCLVNSLWIAQTTMARDELEETVESLREIIADVPAVEGLDAYFDLSYAVLVDVPAARWAQLDRLPLKAESRSVGGTFMLANELLGGMAMRRGDLTAAAAPLEKLRERASASGEPQRILPMANVVLSFAALTGDLETVRQLAEMVLAATDREWAQISTTPIPRALAAAGQLDLLRRVAAAFRAKCAELNAPRIAISATVAEGLTSLAEGRAEVAVARLLEAAEHERRLGWTYRAACLDLDLAAALEASGRGREASAARARAAAVLEPLGCVHAV